MRIQRTVFDRVALFALFLTACAKTGGQSQEHASAKTQQPAAAHTAHWTYEGEEGPAHWGALNKEWLPCSEGRYQSPIDIDQTMNADLPELKAALKPVQLKIIHQTHTADAVNNGHTIQVNYTDGDILSIGEERFPLVQYHFHGPSEHTVHGKHYAMEMHLVHQSAEGKLAVIGVFIEEGEHNTAFDPVWASLPTSKNVEHTLENVTVDVSSLLPADMTAYRYDGSLTTPPCSEGVKWIVMATPIQLSQEQIAAFESIIHHNSRPVQPLNGRAVVKDQVAQSGS